MAKLIVETHQDRREDRCGIFHGIATTIFNMIVDLVETKLGLNAPRLPFSLGSGN